jgi:hypothetical protein
LNLGCFVLERFVSDHFVVEMFCLGTFCRSIFSLSARFLRLQTEVTQLKRELDQTTSLKEEMGLSKYTVGPYSYYNDHQ